VAHDRVKVGAARCANRAADDGGFGHGSGLRPFGVMAGAG
jgi:hypothetical protein